jgi:excinuclease ABC subunit B
MGITPKTIVKGVRGIIEISGESTEPLREGEEVRMTAHEKKLAIEKLEKQMKEAAKMLEFEYAAVLRDKLAKLKGEDNG